MTGTARRMDGRKSRMRESKTAITERAPAGEGRSALVPIEHRKKRA